MRTFELPPLAPSDLLRPASGHMLAVIGRPSQITRLLPELPSAVRETISPLLQELAPADTATADTATSTVSWIAAQSVVPVGVGVLPEVCSRFGAPSRPDQVEALVRDFWQKAASFSNAKRLSLVLAVQDVDEARAAVAAVARALPSYQRKSHLPTLEPVQIAISCAADPAPEREELVVLADAVQKAAHWMDTPADVLHPDAFVAEAREIADSVNAECKVLRLAELQEGGFGGLWNVGRAATRDPALVILSYEPPASARSMQTWAWVGKGIVYDSGGLSLKTNADLLGMKGDMGGAAAALAAFWAAARLQAPHRIHAVLCIAENAIGPDAVRVDDVLAMYSTKTVEVRNTDAEGRLVLADGVAYAARDLQADTVVDLATLTDAAVIATGRKHAAIVCNDEQLERNAVSAGRRSGDLVHALPFCPEFHRQELRSELADMCNVGRDSLNANACVAAQFIHEHLVDFSGRWLHIDLEGPSRGYEGRATGFGVGLLLQLVGCLP